MIVAISIIMAALVGSSLEIFFLANGSHGTAETINEHRPHMVIGASKIVINTSDNLTVGTQVDRVIRDIYWTDSPFDEKVPYNRTPYGSSQVVPYMEGARIRELMEWSQVKVLPLAPAKVKKVIDPSKKDPVYFAADGSGNYTFSIDKSKVDYPSVEWQSISNLEIPDTHGFNEIAQQAYLHRNEIELAIACMDLAEKSQAALYLAQQNINIYAPCDRHANDLMGYKEKYNVSATIMGSAPITKTAFGAVIGNRPVIFYLDETFVVSDTDQFDTWSRYYDSPARYFKALNKTYGLNLDIVAVNIENGNNALLIEKARQLKSHAIGARVYNESDYLVISEWLKEDKRNRAVLLHTVAYDHGARIFREYPQQTTFGDLEPLIKNIRG